MTTLREKLMTYGDINVDVVLITDNDDIIVGAWLEHNDSAILDSDNETLSLPDGTGLYPKRLLAVLTDLAETGKALALHNGNIVDRDTGVILLHSNRYELKEIPEMYKGE